MWFGGCETHPLSARQLTRMSHSFAPFFPPGCKLTTVPGSFMSETVLIVLSYLLIVAIIIAAVLYLERRW